MLVRVLRRTVPRPRLLRSKMHRASGFARFTTYVSKRFTRFGAQNRGRLSSSWAECSALATVIRTRFIRMGHFTNRRSSPSLVKVTIAASVSEMWLPRTREHRHTLANITPMSPNQTLELTASRRTTRFPLLLPFHPLPRAPSLAAAHFFLVDMAVDLSRGKRSLVRVFASLSFSRGSRSGSEAADQSG